MRNLYLKPKNTQKINEVYVVLSEDEGGEGIVNANINGQGFQLVSGYASRLEKITILAKKISHDTGIKLNIYKFTSKELIETIG